MHACRNELLDTSASALSLQPDSQRSITGIIALGYSFELPFQDIPPSNKSSSYLLSQTSHWLQLRVLIPQYYFCNIATLSSFLS